MKKRINIAIDGPAASGKSTVSKIVAEKLGMVYVDTGAMYRAIAWKLLDLGITFGDETSINDALKEISVSFDAGNRIAINDHVLTSEIRTKEVSAITSKVSSLAMVRQKLTLIQKSLVNEKNVIMDGRDIGTVVIPDAELKIYLFASPEVRAQRRMEDLTKNGPIDIDLEQLTNEIKARDEADSTRAIAPLKKADDAIEIDTSSLTREEVINKIIELAEARM